MVVQLINQQRSIWLPLRSLRHQLSTLLACANYPEWDLGVHFIPDTQMRQLNRQYRGRDKTTDILSFPFHPVHGHAPESMLTSPILEGLGEMEGRNLGDMFLSLEYVKRDCCRNNEGLVDRLPVLFAHGICHLLGYDHEADEDYRSMRDKERRILETYHARMANNRRPVLKGREKEKE
ncbi:hypothetical protein LPJ53_003100 [Coemansia erecta]|uniref:Zincin n=1 Tax=Coemansia erecta TaxID=147472 RepID=A0A9W8CT53_9FUNG|nr:hypothetical protein LPJ53_003100 [Coemansia erecta]